MNEKDFRAERMPSPEGRGIAREAFDRAWEAYRRALAPAAEPVARRLAVGWAEDLVGFWLMWHLQGGYEGLRELGMSRSAIYRRINSFRKMFGEHPDVYRFPGVTLDVEAYLKAGDPARKPPGDAPST